MSNLLLQAARDVDRHARVARVNFLGATDALTESVQIFCNRAQRANLHIHDELVLTLALEHQSIEDALSEEGILFLDPLI